MMSLTKILALLLLINSFLFFSCLDDLSKGKDNNNTIGKDTSTVIEYDDADEIEKIYIIDKKSVIFFMPGKKEYAELYKEVGDSYKFELDWLFNNFRIGCLSGYISNASASFWSQKR